MNCSLNEIGMQWPASQACFIYEYSLNSFIWGKYPLDKKKQKKHRLEGPSEEIVGPRACSE